MLKKAALYFGPAVLLPIVAWSYTTTNPVPRLVVQRVGNPTTPEGLGFRNSVTDLSFEQSGNRIQFRGHCETDFQTDYWFRAVLVVYPTTSLNNATGWMDIADKPALAIGLDPKIIGGCEGGVFEATASFALPPGTYQAQFATYIATDGATEFRPMPAASRLAEFTVK